jgi:hypothetical protein
MATVPQNLLKFSNTEYWNFPNAAGNVIHSGDMVCVNGAFDIAAVSSAGTTSAFAGVSMDTYDPTNYGVFSSDPVPPNGLNVTRIGIWYPYATSANTFYPGNPVYYGANAQTVTNSVSGSIVGYVANPVFDPSGFNYASGLAGTNSNQVLCYINRQWPSITV